MSITVKRKKAPSGRQEKSTAEPFISKSSRRFVPSASTENTNHSSAVFHGLRHTAVTRLLEAGTPYPVVGSILGWSAATAIRMSKGYGHIGNQALREATEVLGRTEISTGYSKKSARSVEAENVALQ